MIGFSTGVLWIGVIPLLHHGCVEGNKRRSPPGILSMRSAAVLNHCRDEVQVHVRGCWVGDPVLGKE